MSLQQLARDSLSRRFDETASLLFGVSLDEPLAETSRILKALVHTKAMPTSVAEQVNAGIHDWYEEKPSALLNAYRWLAGTSIKRPSKKTLERALREYRIINDTAETLLDPRKSREEKTKALQFFVYETDISTFRLGKLIKAYPDKDALLCLPKEDDYPSKLREGFIESGKAYLNTLANSTARDNPFTALRDTKEEYQQLIAQLGETAFKELQGKALAKFRARNSSAKYPLPALMLAYLKDTLREEKRQEMRAPQERDILDRLERNTERMKELSRACTDKLRSLLLHHSRISQEEAEAWYDTNVSDPKGNEKTRCDICTFYRMVNGKIKGKVIIKRKANKDREDYSRADNTITLNGTVTNKAVLWHELAHRMDASFYQSDLACNDFVKRRAIGQREGLNDLVGYTKYDSFELAYPDNFIDPYVGKICSTGSEVLSMFFSEELGESLFHSNNAFVLDEEFMQLCLGITLDTNTGLRDPATTKGARTLEYERGLLCRGTSNFAALRKIHKMYPSKALEGGGFSIADTKENILGRVDSSEKLAIFYTLVYYQRDKGLPQLHDKSIHGLLDIVDSIDAGNVPVWYISGES